MSFINVNSLKQYNCLNFVLESSLSSIYHGQVFGNTDILVHVWLWAIFWIIPIRNKSLPTIDSHNFLLLMREIKNIGDTVSVR